MSIPTCAPPRRTCRSRPDGSQGMSGNGGSRAAVLHRGLKMDILVIGAGVVGLAIARALALRDHSVIVAEATGGIGNGVSSRNSEVIHGGMYYPSGSLRARHCVAGRRMLYEFCNSHGVPHRKCGKLIVATNDLEQAKIEGIHQQGLANGVEGLQLISGAEARALEPELACTGAVLS